MECKRWISTAVVFFFLPLSVAAKDELPAGATESTSGKRAPTGFVYHPAYLQHDPGFRHPERPARVQVIADSLKNSPLWSSLVQISPRSAAERWVTTVHRPQYLRQLERAAENAPTSLDADTHVSADSYRVAMLATGGLLAAIDAIVEGQIRNAFVASRPPGHHAFPDRASGFCLINHVAVATRYLQQHHGLQRVLIIDWDVHHGNATQDFFYEDASVLYFSTHQFPHYPGTGRREERGSGAGAGTNINVPLPPGAGDGEVIHAFESLLIPAAQSFKPEFVLISAGFDSHTGDPLADFRLTTGGFVALTKIAMQIADRYAAGRLASVLEGGYNLVNLINVVPAHVGALAGNTVD